MQPFWTVSYTHLDVYKRQEQLSDPAFRQTLKEEYAAFWSAYQQDRDLLRFHYPRPRETWENLKDLDLPRRTFTSDLSQVPTVQHFITDPTAQWTSV